MISLKTLLHTQVEAQSIEEKNETILNSHRMISNLEWNPTLTDEPTFSWVPDCDFHNGIIEVKVMSKFLKDAPDYARGFIGVAFRIEEDFSHYESFYLRPSNATCEDQVRRNHTTQYYSYPDHKWFVLREKEPKKYESYADIAMNEWIQLKIVVNDSRAELYINHDRRPSLLVTDLKLGPNAHGTVALWTEIGTDAYFKDLTIVPL